jgi:hypothetical protein
MEPNLIIIEIKITGNMKRIHLILTMLLINILIICSQHINCNNNNQIDFSIINSVLSDYIESEEPDSGIIILLEYKQKNEFTTILTVLESINHYELFYRKPKCYFIESNRIIYVITDESENKVDTIFLDNLFYETLKTLYYSNSKIVENCCSKSMRDNTLIKNSYRVNWCNDSILSMKGVVASLKYMSFDPIPVQYILIKGKIESKNYVKKVLFPDYGIPKGTSNYFFRKLPYWKAINNSSD